MTTLENEDQKKEDQELKGFRYFFVKLARIGNVQEFVGFQGMGHKPEKTDVSFRTLNYSAI